MAWTLEGPVDNEFRLMICAAYGYLGGIGHYSGTAANKNDVNALMVAEANKQTQAALLLRNNFPQLRNTETKYKWKWRQAKLLNNSNTIYLPFLADRVGVLFFG
eukprot:TRINITY_DN2501_c0_g1_i2.p1 TRINITY_DN2501_c0_g1~~TRINITY_DN2501_c0_g1_i2.p1  ORF type:complete len:104 (-),score=20.88 TRINITY_DN2501_c0_g1_i2:241-552(-)